MINSSARPRFSLGSREETVAKPEKGASETQPGQPNRRACDCAASFSLASWVAPTRQRRPGKGHSRNVTPQMWSVPGLFPPEGLEVRASLRAVLGGRERAPGQHVAPPPLASLVPPTPALWGREPWAGTLRVLQQLGRFVWAQACIWSPSAWMRTKSLDPYAPTSASPPRAGSSPS